MIRAALAYAQAAQDIADLAGDVGNALTQSEFALLGQMHRRAAEIMEAEQAAEYVEAGPTE